MMYGWHWQKSTETNVDIIITAPCTILYITIPISSYSRYFSKSGLQPLMQGWLCRIVHGAVIIMSTLVSVFILPLPSLHPFDFYQMFTNCTICLCLLIYSSKSLESGMASLWIVWEVTFAIAQERRHFAQIPTFVLLEIQQDWVLCWPWNFLGGSEVA